MNIAPESRFRRFAATVRSTRACRGTPAAALLAAKTLVVKAPHAIRQARALAGSAAVRAEVSRSTDAPRVALSVTGGIGDMLVIARFMRDLLAADRFVFDVYSSAPDRAAWAFAAAGGLRASYDDVLFGRMLPHYDLALRANQTAVTFQEHIKRASLKAAPGLLAAADALIRARPAIDDHVRNHPLMDHGLARAAVLGGRTRRDLLHHLAELDYGGDRLAVPRDRDAPRRFGLQAAPYVTVHNGFDPGYVILGRRATKCYPHFDAVVSRLRRSIPGLQFVQLGARTSEPIASCDVRLLDRTTVAEAAGLIAGARLHLDNEGGLVHLAACLGTRSVVVFGPTPASFFAYPSDVAVQPPTCGDCWWTTRTWMDSCPKGYSAPLCMTTQDPAHVADRAAEALCVAPYLSETFVSV